MSHSLAFADSEVASLASSGDGVRIRLSAARVLRVDAAAPARPTEGFARAVELFLPGARLHEEPGHCLGRIAQGRVRIGHHWSSTLPLPFVSPSHAKLELAFANQSSLSLSADGISCRFEGEPNFTESLSC